MSTLKISVWVMARSQSWTPITAATGRSLIDT
jgi:hypothetical protein